MTERKKRYCYLANRLKAVQNEGKEKAAKVEELKKQCSIIQAAITQLSNEKELESTRPARNTNGQTIR